MVAPQIAVLDPLNASAVHLMVGEHLVVVDMHHNGKVTGASRLQDEYFSLVPCVLPPWLRESRIPTAGNQPACSLLSVALLMHYSSYFVFGAFDRRSCIL
jgi:hypothetical protein